MIMHIHHLHENQLHLNKNSLEEVFQSSTDFPILVFDAVLKDYILGCCTASNPRKEPLPAIPTLNFHLLLFLYGQAHKASIMMIDYIHTHWKSSIRLEDLAAAVSYSKNECCRQFKAIFHKTIFEYLNEYRVRQSIPLLTSTSLSIAHIAYECGFGSSSYYISHFKRVTGKTPLEYRKDPY